MCSREVTSWRLQRIDECALGLYWVCNWIRCFHLRNIKSTIFLKTGSWANTPLMSTSIQHQSYQDFVIVVNKYCSNIPSFEVVFRLIEVHRSAYHQVIGADRRKQRNTTVITHALRLVKISHSWHWYRRIALEITRRLDCAVILGKFKCVGVPPPPSAVRDLFQNWRSSIKACCHP